MSRAADLRLVPIAVATWLGAGTMAMMGQRSLPYLLALAALGILLAALRRSWQASIVVVAFAAAACLAWVRIGAQLHDPLSRAADHGAVVSLTVTLRGEPRMVAGKFGPRTTMAGTVVEFSVRGQQHLSKQPILLDLSRCPEWGNALPGQVVQFLGKLEPARRQGIDEVRVQPLSPPAGLAPASRTDRVLHGIHQDLAEVSRSLPGRHAAQLVPAIVLGDTNRVSAQTKDEFMRTGLTHLMAVSGANLSLMLTFCLWLATRARVRGYLRGGLAATVVVLFILLCGPEPSVLRASAMGIVVLLSLGSGATAQRTLRHLSVAVIALILIDPFLAANWGFALSTAATLGLALWARPWAEALASWLPRWLAELVAVPLAAQCATEPLIVLLNGRVSLIGVLANAVAAPFIGPATVAGFVAAGASLISLRLAHWCALPAGWCCEAVAQIAHLCAELPGASLEWPTGRGTWLLLIAAMGLGIAVMPRLLRCRWLCLALALISIVVFVRGPSRVGWPPTDWSVVVCDVGQGNAVVARTGPHEAMLIDVGPDATLLQRCLGQLAITNIPLVVLTHDHADHTAALPELLRHYALGEIMVSPTASAQREQLLAAVPSETPIITARAGASVDLGEAHFSVLSVLEPPMEVAPAGRGESSAENDGSIVGFVRTGGVTALVTGDVEVAGQREATPRLTPVDALIVPHHGSSHLSPEFYQASGAQIALISVGAKNDYGHPSAAALRVIQLCGMDLARTDREGSLALSRVQGELVLTTEKHSLKGQ